MRLHVEVVQRYALNIRGHGASSVRRLEKLRLADLDQNADLIETRVTYRTPTGNFEYELAAPADLPFSPIARAMLADFDSEAQS